MLQGSCNNCEDEKAYMTFAPDGEIICSSCHSSLVFNRDLTCGNQQEFIDNEVWERFRYYVSGSEVESEEDESCVPSLRRDPERDSKYPVEKSNKD